MSEEKAIRVIVVGHTEADAALRRDQSLELVRLGTPMEAIGEVSRSNGHPTVILIGGEGEPRNHGEEAAHWLAGVRRAGPRSRIVRLLGPGDRREGLAAYDAAVSDVRELPSVLRRVAGLEHEDATRANARLSGAEEDALIQRPALVDRGVMPREHETALVSAMIRAQDIRDIALASLAQELGVAAVRLEAERSESATEVRWRDRVFGFLSAEGRTAGDLAPHAEWLASWLRLNEQQAELRRAAFTDPLTGAWNRRYFDRFLPAAIERAKARRGTVTVLMFDIDDFKRFNEKYGHAAGDDILVQTVRLLRSVIRPSDRVFRLGGDEFLVVFDEPDGPRQPGSRPPETVFAISQRFQQQICEHRFPRLGDQAPDTLTISGGLATYPWDGQDASELLARADQLAAESKRIGKNAITLGPGAMQLCDVPRKQ